ncbi:hypothetical protein BOTBODRAFT_192616 [Botryobasidium botryosum FD-172 SS1]|uniref:DUF1275 domain protein n=1 Tax=Botryobasidium botryosum (strain FD-172 SS1) TaxID=930990 RepID=A0A067M671_BOTB1|nr:hypothetical protein BOTBODRAFT_192616 [Botryobasidium botryosum FD-172 SS1]
MPADGKEEEPALPIAHPPPAREETRWTAAKTRLLTEVDSDLAVGPLVWFCFMTGYMDAVSFTATYIWCAFQTGNTIQLSLSLAKLCTGEPRLPTWRISDRQALCSLLAFLCGAWLGRIGDRIGPKKRVWLVLGTLIQAGFTLGSCLCAHASGESSHGSVEGDPSWTSVLGFAALAFASASMGLQAHLGTRLGSQFATSVVLTGIWTLLVVDKKLFEVNHIVKSRDYKGLAILGTFIGGLVGGALINKIGAPATLAIGAGIRVLIAIGWIFTPAAKKA